MPLRSEKAAGVAGASLVFRLSRAVAQLATVALLTRLLGQAAFGSYASLMALVAVLTVPTLLGLPRLVVRETVRCLEAGDSHHLRSFSAWVTRILRRSTLLAVLVGAVVLALTSSSELRSAGPALLLVPATAFMVVRAAQLRALGSGIAAQFFEVLAGPVIFLVLVGAAWTLGSGESVDVGAVVLMRLAGVALALVTVSLLLRRRVPAADRRGTPPPPLSDEARADHLRSLLFLALTGGVYTLNGNLDMLLVHHLLGGEEAALYRIAGVTAGSVAIVTQSLNAAIGPVMAKLLASEERAKLEALIARLVRVGFLPVLGFVLLMAAYGGPLMGLVFGEAYSASYAAMLLLTVAVVSPLWFGVAGLLLSMAGEERRILPIGLRALALNLVLNLMLIRDFGPEGAAFATAVATLVWNLELWRAALVHARVNTLRWAMVWRR